ncbi:hypothetical protein [Moraxella lacunata]
MICHVYVTILCKFVNERTNSTCTNDKNVLSYTSFQSSNHWC